LISALSRAFAPVTARDTVPEKPFREHLLMIRVGNAPGDVKGILVGGTAIRCELRLDR
jgi:hypothetical protein